MKVSCKGCGNELELMVVGDDSPELSGKIMYVCHTCKKLFQPNEVYSRVVGYLRPVGGWNKGKQAEFEQRKTYNIEETTGD